MLNTPSKKSKFMFNKIIIISLKRKPPLYKFSTFSEKDCIPTKLLAFR